MSVANPIASTDSILGQSLDKASRLKARSPSGKWVTEARIGRFASAGIMNHRPSIALGQVSSEEWEGTPTRVKYLIESLVARSVLLDSENQLIQFLEGTPIGITIYDDQGRLIYINSTARSLLPGDWLLYQSGKASLDVTKRSQTMAANAYCIPQFPIDRALAGETIRAENFEIRQAEATIYLELSAQPVYNAVGYATYVVIAFQDISDRQYAEAERKLIENALRQSEGRYRHIIQTQTDFLLHSMPDTSITFANESLCRALGCPLEDIIEQKWLDFAHPEDLPSTLQKIAALTPDNPSFIAENRDRRADGQVGWTQWINKGIFDETGKLIEIQSVGRDITALRQVEIALREAEERQRAILHLNAVGTWDWNFHDRRVIWSEQVFELLGLDRHTQPSYSALRRVLHPDDLTDLNRSLFRTLRDRIEYQHEFRVILPDQSIRWLQAKAKFMNHDSDSPRLLGVLLDISDRKQAELDLRQSEERYRLLAENTNDLVSLHEPNGQYLYISPSCYCLLGYTADEILTHAPSYFWHPEERHRVFQEIQQAITQKQSTAILHRTRQKSGNYIWFETLIKPILNAQSEVVQIQATSRDVTERIQVQEQLKYDALHDSLTGLPNRNLLIDRLALALQRSHQTKNHHFAVLFIDLDRFKVINDSLGHLVGDRLLVAVARTLKSVLRATDLAARLGGDEFVMVLDDLSDLQAAIHAAQRLLLALRMPWPIEGREVYMSASIGIVFGSRHYQEAVHLLRDADIAMYRAKQKGRDRYEVFNLDMHVQALHRLHLEQDLYQALEQQEFILHYQPIMDLQTGQLVGFETLIRWQHPTQGLKAPGEFLPVAEEVGLISALDFWVLQQACQQLMAWRNRFPNMPELWVHVNLSAQDLQRPNLLAAIDRTLSQTQLPVRYLTIEITESMLIEDIDSTIAVLQHIKSRGIHISIDDFGTGYSSLSYLHRLPVDSLKVDRSFVSQIQADRRNRQIVQTIATLSHQLELDAVAEGIETVEQWALLRQLGYRFGQGYLFAKPLSATQVDTLLTQGITMHPLLIEPIEPINPIDSP